MYRFNFSAERKILTMNFISDCKIVLSIYFGHMLFIIS